MDRVFDEAAKNLLGTADMTTDLIRQRIWQASQECGEGGKFHLEVSADLANSAGPLSRLECIQGACGGSAKWVYGLGFEALCTGGSLSARTQ